MGKPAKLFAIEGNKGKHGSLHTRRMLITCKSCGNTERFYGTAYTNPMIIAERKGYDKYDVVEISYKSDGKIDEIIERCAVCGAGRDQLEFDKINDEE